MRNFDDGEMRWTSSWLAEKYFVVRKLTFSIQTTRWCTWFSRKSYLNQTIKWNDLIFLIGLEIWKLGIPTHKFECSPRKKTTSYRTRVANRICLANHIFCQTTIIFVETALNQNSRWIRRNILSKWNEFSQKKNCICSKKYSFCSSENILHY